MPLELFWISNMWIHTEISEPNSSICHSIASASWIQKIRLDIETIFLKITRPVFINSTHPNTAAPRRGPRSHFGWLQKHIHINPITGTTGGARSTEAPNVLTITGPGRANAEALRQGGDVHSWAAHGVAATHSLRCIRQTSDIKIPCFAQNSYGYCDDPHEPVLALRLCSHVSLCLVAEKIAITEKERNRGGRGICERNWHKNREELGVELEWGVL